MSHLKRASSGHLLRNAAGHLVRECGGTPISCCHVGNCCFSSNSTATISWKLPGYDASWGWPQNAIDDYATLPKESSVTIPLSNCSAERALWEGVTSGEVVSDLSFMGGQTDAWPNVDAIGGGTTGFAAVFRTLDTNCGNNDSDDGDLESLQFLTSMMPMPLAAGYFVRTTINNNACWHLSKGDYTEWNEATTYAAGDVVWYGDGFYRSLVADNLGNSPSDWTRWETIEHCTAAAGGMAAANCDGCGGVNANELTGDPRAIEAHLRTGLA